MIAAGFRALWPEARRLLLALTICSALMVLSVLFGERLQGNEAQGVQVFAWLQAGLLWGLLVSARPFHLAWHMLCLRMPGVNRVVMGGIAVHLLSGGLAIAGLALLSPSADVSRIGTALLLGWSLGFLILVLPSHRMSAGLVPLVLVAGHYWPLWWPQSAAQYGALALLALLLAFGLWFCACRCCWRLPPLAVAVEVPARLIVGDAEVALSTRPGAADPWVHASRMRRLGETLGPQLTGGMQSWSGRRRLLSVLLLAAAVGLVMWLEPDRANRAVVAYGMVAACLLLLSQPARYLLAERARISQSLVAELRLLPGLPEAGQYLQGVSLQILRGMLEPVLGMGLALCLIGWDYSFPLIWLQWIWLYLLVILALSLAQALHVGLLGARTAGWRLFEFALAAVAIASSAWLIHANDAALLLVVWIGLLLLALLFCYGLLQRLQQRGAPYFS